MSQKYRLKKDLLWLKAGEVVETEDHGRIESSYQKIEGFVSNFLDLNPKQFPGFFEPITEEEEKVEEAKKLLEGLGAKITWRDEPICTENTFHRDCGKCFDCKKVQADSTQKHEIPQHRCGDGICKLYCAFI